MLGFFAALRTALYGEQQREAQTVMRRGSGGPPPHHKGGKRGSMKKSFGILEKVEEVGVENLLSASPLPEEDGSGRWSFGQGRSPSASSRESSVARSEEEEEDEDELEPVQPGSLTINTAVSTPAALAERHRRPKHQQVSSLMPPQQQHFQEQQIAEQYHQQQRGLPATVGQLQAPSFSLYGRPSLDPRALGSLPPSVGPGVTSAAVRQDFSPVGGVVMGGRGPGRVVVLGSSPGERRPAQLSGALGVPATPGTGALLRQQRAAGGGGGVRTDLGSVPMVTADAPAAASSPGGNQDDRHHPGFIGSIANIFFGRKGGLL